MLSDKERCDALVEKLYPKMYPTLVNYAKLKVSSMDTAEELAQETFVKVCENPSKFITCENPSGWLVNTLKNLLRNYLREREYWSKLLQSASDEVIMSLPAAAQHLKLKDMYAGLVSDDELDLIIAIDVSGLTCREMANKLCISIDACQKRLNRAEKKFKENLEKSENKCPRTGTSIHVIEGGAKHVE